MITNGMFQEKDLYPIEELIRTFTAKYPGHCFSFSIDNFDGKVRYGIYADKAYLKPCGSCHCNCGNDRDLFIKELNKMLNNTTLINKERNKLIKAQIKYKENQIEKLQESIIRLEKDII